MKNAVLELPFGPSSRMSLLILHRTLPYLAYFYATSKVGLDMSLSKEGSWYPTSMSMALSVFMTTSSRGLTRV